MSQLKADRPLERSQASVASELSAVISTDFMQAVVAAGALMAFADGEMARAERSRILRHLQENPLLAAFSHAKVVAEIAAHESNFRFDPEVAQMLAREKVMRIAGHRRLARKTVAFCREIIPADGVAHPGEYRVLSEIAVLLGIEDVAAASSIRRGPSRFIPRAVGLVG